MVAAAAQQFPLPPPPNVFQSQENLRPYLYDEEIPSSHSGEETW